MSLSTSFLDRYIDHQSPIHALDARIKLVITLGFIFAAALLPPGSWVALGALACLLWAVAIRGHINPLHLIRQAFVALPFALIAVTIVFSRPGEVLFHVPLGMTTLTATDAGLIAFVTIVIKSWLSVQAAMLLTMTTHFIDVLQALRALHLPAIIVSILSFAYRYLFVLIEEAGRLLRARECRSAEVAGKPSGGSIIWRAAVVGRMVGTLFLRSYERSERIYVAMLSRGYNGEIRSLAARPLTAQEQGVLITSLALLAGVVAVTFFLM